MMKVLDKILGSLCPSSVAGLAPFSIAVAEILIHCFY